MKVRLWTALLGACLGAGTAGADYRYVDIAVASGVDFNHRNGAEGLRYLPETYGSGVALFDADGDGMLDIYLVNAGALPALSQAAPAANRLFRRAPGGRYADATASAGVGDTGYGMGAAVGDYDNDGRPDLYITNFGANVLYRNGAPDRFIDVTGPAGVGDEGWGTSAAFADIDLDGDLDLFVGNYLDYPTAEPLVCRIGNSDERIYCDPRKFSGQEDRLYINGGPDTGWAFADRTREMGLASRAGKELGVVFGDIDLDGDPDLYLANDMAPNMLYRNDGARFVEKGLASGTSLNDEGGIEAGMGVDMADADGDGYTDLFVTNFQWESNTLYRNLGNGFFYDATVAAGITRASMAYLGFGTGFLDSDLDGDLDLFVANGHVMDTVDQVRPAQSYPQPNQIFTNAGGRTFADRSASMGPSLAVADVSRATAVADYDNDGDLDLLVTNVAGRPNLLRNDGGNRSHWLLVELVGAIPPDALGARVTVAAGGVRQVRERQSAGSYLSANDPRLHFGLGSAARADVTIRWPDGSVQGLTGVAADQILRVVQSPGR